MPELFRSAARAYIRRFPVEKGKFHLAEAMRKISPREKIVSKVNDRFLMELDLTEFVQGLLYYYGYYEKGLTQLIQKTLVPGSVMIDVGANMGTFSLLAASLGATSHAFEASPDVCAALRRNISLNQFNSIVVHECALADRSGETSFYLYEEAGDKNMGQNALFRRGAGREIRVPMVTLDSALSDLPRLDFIKSDVEGADFLVFRGARALLEKFHPVVAVEASEDLAEKLGGSVKEIVEILWEHGYDIQSLTRAGLFPVDRTTPLVTYGTLIARHPGSAGAKAN